MATLAAPFDVPQKPGDEIKIQAAAVKNYRGGAAAIVLGVGYATPLVIATASHRFIGVYLEGNDNSSGVAGTINNQGPYSAKSSWVRVARRGCYPFNQTGIVQASVRQPVFFSDDNTVTTTAGKHWAGNLITIDEAGLAWVDIEPATARDINTLMPQIISADGAIAPSFGGTYVVTKAGVAAMTLAAPTAGTHDGMIIEVKSSTTNAHTLTTTGLLQCGTAATDLATFAAFGGAGVKLMAYNAKWIVLASVGITFS